MTSAEAFIHPLAENRVNDRSSAASRTGSGLCRASSRSGSLVSHTYGGTVDVGATIGAVPAFSPVVTTETSDGALLNREAEY